MANQVRKGRTLCAAKKIERAGASDESGFTLIETVIAFLVVMIAALGVVSVFMYSVNYNTGGSNRLQSIAIAQQQLEQLRTAKFNAPVNGVSKMDAILTGGTTTSTVTGADGRSYTVETTIDDDLNTAGVQTNTTTTLKGIQITVTPGGAGPTWAANSTTSAVTIVTQRVRMN